MTDFSIEFEEGSDITEYFNEFKKNIKKTPFISAKLFIEDNHAFFHIKPLMFPMYWFAPVIWIIGYIFTGRLSRGFFLAGMVPGLTFLLYTKYWYIMMLYIGKWKGKYKGKIQLL